MKNLICRYDLDQRNEEESVMLAINLLEIYNTDLANEFIKMIDGNDEVWFEDVLGSLEEQAMRKSRHSVYVEESQLYIIDDSKA